MWWDVNSIQISKLDNAFCVGVVNDIKLGKNISQIFEKTIITPKITIAHSGY